MTVTKVLHLHPLRAEQRRWAWELHPHHAAAVKVTHISRLLCVGIGSKVGVVFYISASVSVHLNLTWRFFSGNSGFPPSPKSTPSEKHLAWVLCSGIIHDRLAAAWGAFHMHSADPVWAAPFAIQPSGLQVGVIGRTLLQCHIKPEHFIYCNLVWTGFWQWLGLGKHFMTSTRKVGMLLCRGKQQWIKIIITQGHSDKSNQTSKIRYTGWSPVLW